MKWRTAIVLLILAAPLAASAQTDKAVERIRRVYTQVSEQARLAESDPEHGETGPLVMNELKINSLGHQWRAVGIYRQNFRFFYRGGDSEKHLYPDELVLVKTERRSSNRNYTEEYLFDGAGKLIFYFQKAENDDREPAERRVYFAGGKAVHIIEDGRAKTIVGKVSLANDILTKSSQIAAVFKRSIAL